MFVDKDISCNITPMFAFTLQCKCNTAINMTDPFGAMLVKLLML